MIKTIAIALLISVSAQADLVTTFKKMDTNRKGPFSLNMLQGSMGRVVVNQGTPAGEYQFQAAFRNEIGIELAKDYNFFVGNLFTTNYYELMGEYVYANAESHPVDHAALLAVAPQAMPKAVSMVRSWVLEKHYIANFPASAIVKGFKLRGISGAEFEQAYAFHFFNFYLSSMTVDFQYLPAFLLAKTSAIAESSSLDRARTLIAAAYEDFKLRFGEKEPIARKLYDIRNVVHNSLSQAVISQIDGYIREFGGMLYPEDTAQLIEVQDILRSYYSLNASRIVSLAKKAGNVQVQTAAESIVKNGNSPERMLALSTLVANLRGSLADNAQVPYANKTNTLVLISTSTQFLNKEINAMAKVTSKDVIKTLVNVAYAEGFLIRDNWQYFLTEVENAADVKTATAQLANIVEIGNDTLVQAFTPSYEQWVLVEPKMNYFIDSTIKSSVLSTASLVEKKVK
ncbi:MAG: hypothetical protein V4736_15025 [Bdellovibrionota bacterium]